MAARIREAVLLPVLVDFFVEKSLGATLGCFAITLVFINIRDHTVIEAGFAGVLGIKGLISVEECTLNIKP